MVPDKICKGFVLHPNFQQARAATARLACKMPNFQNVPNIAISRGMEPVEARRPFGPRKGYVWYHPDYSSMEARIYADEANDKKMLKAFRRGEDVFNDMTNRLYGGETDIAMNAGLHTGPADNVAKKIKLSLNVCFLNNNSSNEITCEPSYSH